MKILQCPPSASGNQTWQLNIPQKQVYTQFYIKLVWYLCTMVIINELYNIIRKNLTIYVYIVQLQLNNCNIL